MLDIEKINLKSNEKKVSKNFMGILMNCINIWNPNVNEYFEGFILKQCKCENWSMLPMVNLSQKEKTKL